MKDPLIKGHPLHAILSDLPIGTAIAGVAFDIVAAVTHARPWRFAANAALGSALASGSVAALVGLWDYQAVPHEHPARRTGAVHGWLNASALLLLLLSLILRRQPAPNSPGMSAASDPGSAARGLSLGALLVLGASEWFGGELVFKLGWRVTPAEHAEQLEADLRQSGEEERITKAHQAVQQYEQTHTLLP
jgi:uncharacterized membrane protein